MLLHSTKRGIIIYSSLLFIFKNEAGDLSLKIDSHEIILSSAHISTSLNLNDEDMTCELNRESH